MKIVKVEQGSPEWHAHRLTHDNASELASVMGEDPDMPRSELVRLKATGAEKEFSQFVKDKILASGHAAEAAARPFVSEEVGEDLFPIVGVSDEYPRLSASYDGTPMDWSFAWECKVWNEKRVAQVRNKEITEPKLYWQFEQQLLVCPEMAYVKVTISKPDGSERVSMDYYRVPGRAEKIMPAWNQFRRDVAACVHEEPAAQVIAAPVIALPAVSVQIAGTLDVLSNLPTFEEKARAFIAKMNPAPESDQDFADAEAEVKALKNAESQLDAAEDSALAQIAVVDQMRKHKAMLSELLRSTRLAREKLVKDRKDFVRAKIQSDAVAQIEAHRRDTEKLLGGNYLPPIPHDIAGAMKGKKTMASLKDAAATAVAKWKIEADAATKIINANLALLDEHHEHAFLFNDKKTLVLKDPEAVAAIVAQRISAHEAEQRAKVEAAAEAAREKIRREEQAKAEAEARARADAERRERERAEAAVRAEQARVNAEQMAATLAEVTPPAAVDVTPQAPPATLATTTVVPTIIDDQMREIEQAAPVSVAPKPSREMPETQQIVNAVALHFGVAPNVAARWLHSLNQAELARVAA